MLEGGFDDDGTFFYIPFSGLDAMVEVFRRRVISLLVEKELLAEEFAIKLLGCTTPVVQAHRDSASTTQ